MMGVDRYISTYSRRDVRSNSKVKNDSNNKIPPSNLNNPERIQSCKVIEIENGLLDKTRIYNIEIKTEKRDILGKCQYDDIQQLATELSKEFIIFKDFADSISIRNNNERDIQVKSFFDQIENLPEVINNESFIKFTKILNLFNNKTYPQSALTLKEKKIEIYIQ